MRTNFHVTFRGKLLIIGMGSIGQGTLPLIFRHIKIRPEQVTIIAADKRGKDIAALYGVTFIEKRVTQQNYKKVINVGPGDFLLNLAVDISSLELIRLCQERGALYLDTCIEPWKGWYADPKLSIADRSNYALHEAAKSLRKEYGTEAPTAILTHGANPGLVSHLLKEALLSIANDYKVKYTEPETREQWAALAKKLGIKSIHIAERDTQASSKPKEPGEFVNTWSIDGFYSEGVQPAELGWGTHERHFPEDGNRHTYGSQAAIYLDRPSFWTHVRSWTPMAGPIVGKVITHDESISIADYFTVRKGKKVTYRPTVHYAYHPCDAAVLSLHEMMGRGGKLQKKHRLIMDEILPGGVDELGVLLMGHKGGAYWYGSQLSIDQARRLVPYTNATGLQVTATVLAGMVYAMENPNKGIVDANEVDYKRIMQIARPYLGRVVGKYTDWTPLQGRLPEDNPLFPERIDEVDPWQFLNFRIN